MHQSIESIAVILTVGIVAGLLARQLVQGTEFGLLGDLTVGIVGACIGYRLMPELNIHLGEGIVAWVIDTTLGASVLLLAISLVQRRNRSRLWASDGWGRRWGGRW